MDPRSVEFPWACECPGSKVTWSYYDLASRGVPVCVVCGNDMILAADFQLPDEDAVYSVEVTEDILRAAISFENGHTEPEGLKLPGWFDDVLHLTSYYGFTAINSDPTDDFLDVYEIKNEADPESTSLVGTAGVGSWICLRTYKGGRHELSVLDDVPKGAGDDRS